MNVPARPYATFDDLGRPGRVCLVLLALGVLALSWRLWPEWVHNPDLSHGFFMPMVFLLLLNEARHAPPRFTTRHPAAVVGFSLLLIGSLAALFVAALYAAAVDWSHPLVNLSITIAAILLLTAGWMIFSHDGMRFVGWNWSAFVAIALWLLCTPIPPGTYSRLTVTLQLWVSESVLQTLHLLGIAAVRHGNIIELGRTTVGVEEACSGIRSLISCVFAGMFFSATLVRRPWARAVVILLSAPLALGMNFVRSLTLTLLSNGGVDISGGWHDATGFAVLGITAALLAALAFLLERGNPRPRVAEPPEPGADRPRPQIIALTSTLGLAAALIFYCVVNTRPSVRADSPAPNLDALLPKDALGWEVITSSDLYQFRETLQTDHLLQRAYRKPGPDGRPTELIVYAAYWRPGQAAVNVVASHTPDACWPGSGWTAQPVARPRVALHVDGRTLPDAEYRFFTLGAFPQHVWFWHLYDGQPLAFRDPYSAIELLRIAWKYGFRHDGSQLFVRVSSNRPWADLEREPLLADIFSRTRATGL